METKKKEKTKIDIILPNYNSSQFIIKTINSILKQTYKNWKLIIVDDFSDKKTKKILKEISKNKNINYLSKIDVINFNFKKDYIVGTNFTFSDTDHWNDFGEIYFGRRIILSPMIKNIFYP